MELKIKKLNGDAVIPSYAHDGDVGMDLTAISVEYDAQYDMYVYHTGLSVETDKGYGVFLFLRSSNRKTDCYMCNHVGIVDSAIYRGEMMICVKNRDSLQSKVGDGTLVDPMEFAPYKVGDRVAQMVVLPYPKVDIKIVDELSDSDRGEGGFGSTGA